MIFFVYVCVSLIEENDMCAKENIFSGLRMYIKLAYHDFGVSFKKNYLKYLFFFNIFHR